MTPEIKKSFVSRSVYQKLAEENKRLLHDIYILCSEKYTLHPEKIIIIQKWRDKIKKDRQFNALLKQYAIDYFEKHPEEMIVPFKDVLNSSKP